MHNWILRVGNGNHFISSSKDNTWGVNSEYNDVKYFLSNVKEGDPLWFVKTASKGLIVAMAIYVNHKKRELGPLIALTKTNEELGWTETDGNWDTEIHYKNLYNLTECGLLTEIKSPRVIRTYNEKCKIDLPQEYANIVRYSKITTSM